MGAPLSRCCSRCAAGAHASSDRSLGGSGLQAAPLTVGVQPEKLKLLGLVVAEFFCTAATAVAGAAVESRGEFEAEVLDVFSQCAERTL